MLTLDPSTPPPLPYLTNCGIPRVRPTEAPTLRDFLCGRRHDVECGVQSSPPRRPAPPRTALTERKLALSDVVELYRIGHYASRCINPNIASPITRLRQFVSAVTSWRVADIRGDVTLTYLTTGARHWRPPSQLPVEIALDFRSISIVC